MWEKIGRNMQEKVDANISKYSVIKFYTIIQSHTLFY